MSVRDRQSGTKNLVKIYVTPETAYHLNEMMFQSKVLKYPGQVVDKIVRSIVTERKYRRKGE